MNYIKQLEATNAALEARLKATEEAVAAFKSHLALPKFQGHEPDGSRKDWMATADIHQQLARISSALAG